MGGENGDIAADELFDDIKQAIITNQTVHERIGHQHIVMELFGTGIGMSLCQPMHMFCGFTSQVGIDSVTHDGVALFIIFLSQSGSHDQPLVRDIIR